jgi:MFS family permease
MTDPHAIEAEIERNFRHNFVVNFLNSTFFWCGMSFIAVRTILPLYVSHFTDNEVVIGLVPAIFSGGWLLPQLFTANWVQRLPRKKIAPVRVGLFSERLPILLLALSAWWLPTDYPQLALVAFFLIFTWNQFGGGLIAVAWQDMVAKIFPTDRRGRFLGFSHFSGTAMGVLCAAAATWFLEQYGFPKGYALSFSVGAVCIFISWSFLALTREPAQVSEAPQVSQREYLRSLPAVVRSDTNFARYLLNQAVWALSGMGTGFVAVYAVQRWSLPDSIAGSFTAALLVGQAAGNLFFGPLADRKGHKLVLEISAFLGALSFGLAFFAPTHNWIFVVFAFTGFSTAGLIISSIAIVFEFTIPETRPTYIGLANTTYGITAVVAPLFGGWMVGVAGYQVVFGLTFAVGVVAFITIRWWVKEPRVVVGRPFGS